MRWSSSRLLLGLLVVVVGMVTGCLSSNTNPSPDGGSPSIGTILTASPATQDFGTVNVGAQSASVALSIANTGTATSAPLVVTPPTVGGPFGIDADGCSGTTLAAGASCKVSVHFAPTSAGAATDGIQLAATGAMGTHVALSGTGVSATAGAVTLSFTPATVDFGNVGPQVAIPPANFTLLNSGTATSAALALAITGSGASAFGLSADTCTGKTLAAGASCTATVSFGPQTGVTSAATLTATAGAATATASLSGSSIAPAALGLSLSTFDFGAIVLGGTTSAQTFSVANGGGSPSGVVSVTLGGTDAADFAIASNGCTTAIAPNSACSFTLTFAPSKAAAETATVTVTDGTSTVTAAVTGTGLAVAALTITPATKALGTVAQGASGTDAAFVVTNTGGVATGALTASLGGSNASQFGLGTDGCTGKTLAAKGSCTVNAHFAPTGAGTLGNVAATLQITGTPGGTAAASLTGNAVPPATLSIGASSQAFGAVVQGASSGNVPITVTNAGGVPTGVLTASLGGANAAQFGLGTDACTGQTLAAGASCVVNVRFAPGAAVLGVQQATLSVTATPGGTAALPLTGTSVTPAALTVTPGSQSWGTVVQGAASADVTLSVANTGGVTTGALTVSLGGANAAQFAIATDACTGKTIAPAATCIVAVHFAPTLGTLGVQQATLTVSGSPGGSVPATLIGTAATPLGISPATQNLGVAAFGSPGTAVSFTVTNAAAISVGPLAVSLTGIDGAQFVLGPTNTCAGATLAAKGTCTLQVSLAPTSGTTGAMTAGLLVSGGASTTTQAVLTGSAVDAAAVSFASPTESFNSVVQGASSGDVPLTLTNTGGVPTGTLTTTLAGANAASFGPGTDTCTGKVLAAGASCAVSVHFAPGATVLGAQQATLTAAATPGGTSAVALSGTAVTQAAIALSPASQTFASAVQGSTTADITFTATNSGGVATGPLAVALGAQFAITSDGCTGQSLSAGGGTCAIKAHFAPTVGTLGSQQTTLSVTGAPGGTAPATLIGVATSPLSVTPPTGTFPNTASNAPSASISFTVKNASASAIGPLTVTLGGTNATNFQLASGGTCGGATLAGGGSATCTVNVVFAPVAGTTGTQLATLTIQSGANTSTQATLSGTAVLPPALSIAGTGNFNTVVQGDVSSNLAFTVSNSGGLPTGTMTIALGGTNANQFGIVGNTCPTVLAAGASCTLSVVFGPADTTLGTQTATLTASANPGGSAPVALTGTAVTQAAIGLGGTGTFANTVAGSTSASSTFTVTNGGGVATGTLAVSSLGTGFAVIADTCTGAALAAGGSCAITVQFTPTLGSLGSQQATLTVSGTPGGSASTTLSGVATAPLSVSPASDPFGTIAYGTTTSPIPFIVTNNSASAVGPLNVALTGTNATQFQITSQTCTKATLTGGTTCAVYVAFAPSSGTLGAQSAVLDVNAGTNQDTQATLSGTSATPANLVLSPTGTFDFGSVLVGTASATETYTLTNNGGVTSGSIELYANDSEFQITGSTCLAANGNTDTLAAGESCTFGVYYKPSVAIAESANLSATATPGGSPNLTITGTGHNATYTLTIDYVSAGGGCGDDSSATITYAPPTTACKTYPCTIAMPWSTKATITETTQIGKFQGWTGACTGSAATCNVTMTSDQTVTFNVCGVIS